MHGLPRSGDLVRGTICRASTIIDVIHRSKMLEACILSFSSCYLLYTTLAHMGNTWLARLCEGGLEDFSWSHEAWNTVRAMSLKVEFARWRIEADTPLHCARSMAAPAEPMPPMDTPEWDAWAAQDKGTTILVTCWVFNALATLFVIGRLYVRIGMQKHLLSDDYWCLIGLICGYLSVGFTVVAVEHGNGRHYSLLSDEQKQSVMLWTTCAFCPGVLCFGLPKMAVVSLLTRLLNPSKYHRWFLWTLAIWCLLTLFATVGTLLGRCMPAESIWNFAVKGTCVDPKHIVNFSLYAGAYSAFVDVYLAVYPALILWNLQIKLKKKIALICALGIGTASRNTGSYYRDPKNFQHRDVEMGSYRPSYHSRRQKPVEHPDLDITMLGSCDSQEELHKQSRSYRSDEDSIQQTRNGHHQHTFSEDSFANEPGHMVVPHGHEILKTNVITVTYDAKSAGVPMSTERWKAIRD
ncbi:hypothetical protein HJFPF1_05524 [Paramyrothecium foliicola]|nr:hypothetical protein HJFPF1_05524 [Paramyrothecium foliicola]